MAANAPAPAPLSPAAAPCVRACGLLKHGHHKTCPNYVHAAPAPPIPQREAKARPQALRCLPASCIPG
eukprot:SAG22_NODE_21059_length_260_cov_0.906832_1_plen_67_part_01